MVMQSATMQPPNKKIGMLTIMPIRNSVRLYVLSGDIVKQTTGDPLMQTNRPINRDKLILI